MRLRRLLFLTVVPALMLAAHAEAAVTGPAKPPSASTHEARGTLKPATSSPTYPASRNLRCAVLYRPGCQSAETTPARRDANSRPTLALRPAGTGQGGVILAADTQEPDLESLQTGDSDTPEDEGEGFGDGFDEGFGDDLENEFQAAEKARQDIWDPLEGYNRVITVFNDRMYFWVLDPLARGYNFVVPELARKGVNNFFHNLLFPLRFVNNTLQGKLLNACEELARFCINTTIGILGLWDPAREWFGLEPHNEDLGQTLGYWGVGAGPHIVLPFFGPSNLRDAFSSWGDYRYLDPRSYLNDTPTEYGLIAFEEFNYVSLHLGEYDNLKKDALDLYTFLRDVYEQNRKMEIMR
ncbi:MAG: VacJ family lipoprotein [Deltaproteobacteria bacterium]|nr:VacJ family lipoprotein [Deltaproteobacteria bacterium]